MGIPFYYRQIVAKDQKKLICDVAGCDHLYLDFNSIIHTSAANVISKNDEFSDTQIFDEVFKHTLYVASVCKPSSLLYIAVDGVAPRSKINQQRKRRFLSAYRNNIINRFKEKNNIKYAKWDSNAITPGTEFMKSLHAFLMQKISQTNAGFQIVLSGYDQPGEGEHKIFQHMHANSKSGDCNVIYGLDADLIMLSLCCENDVYLMREGNDFFTGLTDFKFLDIKALRKCVSKYIYDSEEIGHMYDYVFFCFLLGNDFLPNISCLKIKSGAIEALCAAYKEVFNGEHLIVKKERFEINMQTLSKLFETLAKKEDGLMREATQQYYSSQAQSRSGGKLDRFIAELDSYPTINKFPLVINPSEDSAWKNSYYHHLFGTHHIHAIKNIVQNYIEGLSWTMNYYFNKRFDASWFYMYNYAPCMSDIYKYIGSVDVSLDFNSASTIDTELQLLMVMPPASKGLIAPEMQKIMEELDYGCAHYYPTRFFLTSYMKSFLWECIPVLPNVDLHALKKAREACYKNVTTI